MSVIERAGSVPVGASALTPSRQTWVDNLRTLMIVLVVNIHACVTYSHVGSWYFNSPPEPSIPQKIPFFFWQSHLQSFFMGLLFFVSGYYADRSLSRRGVASFRIERLKRLGIPTLLYMLAIHPLIVLVLLRDGSSGSVLDYYRHELDHGRFLGHSGPMWFAFALLVFSLVFCLFPAVAKTGRVSGFEFKGRYAVGLGLVLGLSSFLVRTIQPQGTNILNFQLCYFSQYVAGFILGVVFSRKDWLGALAESRNAARVGLAGLILGPVAWVVVVMLSLPVPAHGPIPLDGGWNLMALLYAIWEQMTGVALAVGTLSFCARKLNFRSKVSAWMSDRSFAVYLLHAPVLIAITLVLQPYRTGAVAMAAATTVLAVAASFVVADLARRIPGLKLVV